MLVAFELSIPNKASWNGRWSGESRTYARVRNISPALAGRCAIEEILKQRTFTYRWDDGWCAAVTVRKVDAKEALRLRKQSVGFYGYDWMIKSIIDYGEIVLPNKEAQNG